jgi:hypothetical protein
MPFRKSSKKLFNRRPFHALSSDRICVEPFDVRSLGSEAVMKLYREATSCRKGISIEIVAGMRRQGTRERNPATTLGLELDRPTVRFSDSLDKAQRMEAIAHELTHLLFVYRYGLGVIGRRVPRPGDRDDVFRFFMSMRGDWVYLLGQIANTAHHLLLIDYLRKEYGIESDLYRGLLEHNLRIAAKDNGGDKESLYAKGIIAFEYDRLVGNGNRMESLDRQPELFWKAYDSMKHHFGEYRLSHLPTPSKHEANVFSLLEDLGYEREDFTFFP